MRSGEYCIFISHSACVNMQTNQEDVCAELEDAVHTGQLLKHDGVGDLAEEATHKLPNDQHHRHIQTHDPGRRHETSAVNIWTLLWNVNWHFAEL